MSETKISLLILSAVGEAPLPGLEDLPGDTQIRTVTEESELREALPKADILLITDFRRGLLERCWPQQHELKWVHTASAGYDTLMFPALKNSDIVITNARGVFDRGIAEYVLGAVMLFAKDTLGNLHLQRQHQWQHRNTALVKGQKALIVGAGSIGGEVAHVLSAIGMKVTGIASSARTDPRFEQIVDHTQLPDCLPDADHVIITAPLTDATRGLFDRHAFAAMKPSASLINVGRGPIVNTEDLIEALRKSELAGAALDVFEKEPLPVNHPLWDFPNVMISAHMAGDFHGWRRALGEQFAANLRRWLAGESLMNQVKLQ